MTMEREEKELTSDDWYNLIVKKIKDKGSGYYISWWLRIDTGLPTSKINYELKKLVKAGKLKSKSFSYGIEYSLPNPSTP